MKSLTSLLLLFVPFFCFTQSEPSTEKFIRIVGLSEKVLDNTGIKVSFTLSDIEGNEYKQIRPKSLEEVKAQFREAAAGIGVDVSTLEQDYLKNITKSRYNKQKVEHFNISVESENEVYEISNLAVDGYKMVEVNYLFGNDYEDFVEEMTIEAINDAKRKATNIAKAIGKSVGTILNIEDMKNYKASNTYGKSKSDTKKLTYQVNVTFELL